MIVSCKFQPVCACSVLDQSDLPSASPIDCPDEVLCSEEVFMLLGTLDCSKANGVDNIAAEML